jgi:transposase
LVDRDQAFLMPPSLRDWLPDDHLAWFVLDVVGRLDTRLLHRGHRNDGVGRAAFDPDMLLSVVLYGYAVGVRSSRQLERSCATDVAFRVLCAQDVPDHSTLSRFIAAHGDAVGGLFAQVLTLCAQAGMVKVGTVAIDGTKIAANASLAASKSRDWLAEQARRIVAEGIATDEAEDAEYGDARGDELPPELATRAGRAARIEEALRQLDEVADPPAPASTRKARRVRAQQPPAVRPDVAATGRRPSGRAPIGTDRVAEAQAVYDRIYSERDAEYTRLCARRETARAAGQPRPGGRKPIPAKEHFSVKHAAAVLQAAKDQAGAQAAAEQPAGDAGTPSPIDRRRANVTDPDSRIMKAPGGFVQGYNAQAAVTDDQIVLAATVTQDHNDHHQLQPMMTAAVDAARALAPAKTHGGIGCVLADAGYCTDDNLGADGPDRLIATANLHTLDGRRHSKAPPPRSGSPRAAMQKRLSDPEQRERYKRRSQLVEPVFGQVKEQLRIRRFSRRGLANVQAEWNPACLAHNLLKLHRHNAIAPG